MFTANLTACVAFASCTNGHSKKTCPFCTNEPMNFFFLLGWALHGKTTLASIIHISVHLWIGAWKKEGRWGWVSRCVCKFIIPVLHLIDSREKVKGGARRVVKNSFKACWFWKGIYAEKYLSLGTDLIWIIVNRGRLGHFKEKQQFLKVCNANSALWYKFLLIYNGRPVWR